MNYKTFVLWIVGGLCAYISGRSGNNGLSAYFAVLSGTFLFLGVIKLLSYSTDKTPDVTVNVNVNNEKKTTDKKFKVGDTVKVIKSSCVIDEPCVGKIGKIIKKAPAFDWFVGLDNGLLTEPLDEYQLELVSSEVTSPAIKTRKYTKKKARRGTITLAGMTKKQKRAIYNARWTAKKRLSK